jgi:hypothetical protein
MIEIAQALTAVTAAIGLAKELSATDRAIDKADLKLKAAELTSALADAKIALSTAQDQIRDRDKEIAKLKASFKKAQETIEHHGFHYEQRNGKAVGMPFCPHCMSSGFLSRLDRPTPGRGKCPNCKNEFNGVSCFRYEDAPDIKPTPPKAIVID